MLVGRFIVPTLLKGEYEAALAGDEGGEGVDQQYPVRGVGLAARRARRLQPLRQQAQC